ncbi:30S ribosomal protein S6 [Pajaroellobacter abortibovis]|uniref:Small ribosomal subunit protein bS6 n=1 Tax=Pajaroellobacter abortibovis TaxID=1882918 RepID=A0A1L6MXT0_9BACT|nr:30S ribosomal protein S6 [Pajaroellobacter abortibovis]APS00310.1 30S ribosomal protein S6 [Pajaroellobacter abortibovis]
MNSVVDPIHNSHRLSLKEYETIYVLRPDVDADTVEKVQSRVTDMIGLHHGRIIKVEAWGRRKLAYPVQKQKRGVYIYVRYVGQGPVVQELEHHFKLQEVVMKFQTIRLKEKVKEVELQIDPEEIKLRRLELPPEEEEKESREKALGLLGNVSTGSSRWKSREMRNQDDESDDEEREEEMEEIVE